jgi:hypothetical protein
VLLADEHDLQSYFHTLVSPQTFANKLTDRQQATWVIEDKTNDKSVALLNIGPCCLPHLNIDTSKDGETIVYIFDVIIKVMDLVNG